MTDREKAIVMAYTGAVMLSGDKLGVFYQYVQEKLGHCVMTHELAYQEVQDAIADAARDDFIELAKNNNVHDKNVGKWISVKDRMPEERINPNTNDFEYVLCATTFGDVRAYKYGMIDGNTEAHFWHGFGMMDKYITHWMPLPEPPKEEDSR